MNLNERERKIAIGVLIALVLMLAYYFAYVPYAAAHDQVLSDEQDVTDKLDHATSIFRKERLLQPVWAEMQKGGLNVDAARAASQTLEGMNAWANDCGFTLITYKPERTSQAGVFEVYAISATGNGSMPRVARMLADIEMAQIPIRVSELSIAPQKEGTDDLNVRFSLSALCQPPAGSAPPKTTEVDNSGGAL